MLDVKEKEIYCVCGGRDYSNKEYMFAILDRILHHCEIEDVTPIIMSGCATGADSLALEWAKKHGVETMEFPADWKTHGKAAGPIRNREMLKAGFDVLLAFPGGKGTADMINITKQAGTPVVQFKR